MEAKEENLALLALLEYEERVARWRMFPEESRTAFVEELARLMTQVAGGGPADDRP